ncbi:MAG: argininosuccinate lyase [Bacillota bacterium]
MSNEKSWQARISEATDKLAQSFVESISYDRRMYKQDIAGSIAHATMLAKVGLITDADRDAIIQGLESIEADIEAGRFTFDESLEDIHMVIEAALIERIGEPGRRLHTARSRNDQVALDLLLWLRDHNKHIETQLVDICRAFVDLASRSVDVVMPSYTHLQRAQPICAAAEPLAWVYLLNNLRVVGFGGLIASRMPMPLGSGAIAGTSLPIDPRESSLYIEMWQSHPDLVNFALQAPRVDRLYELKDSYLREQEQAHPELTSDDLEERDPQYKFYRHIYGPTYLDVPESSIAHTATRDEALDFVYWLTRIAMILSRWAEQWIIYSTTEFSFVKIADRYTTGSSMMPQKRNPDMLELIRGRCGCVYGDLVALMTILKGLPIGYNRDLQEDKRIVFRAYDTVTSCLTMAAAIVSSANYIKENIEPTLERGFLDATSLAEYFVTKGIPFRTAHQIVGSLVARCEKEGKHALTQLKVEDFIAAAKSKNADASQIGPDVFDALGARNVVNRYRSAGAAGGKPLQDQLKAWKERLGM